MAPPSSARLLSALALGGLAVLLGVTSARGAPAARATSAAASRGEHIARTVCSACHVVAADQEFPPLLERPTPSFREIANRPGTSAQSLERFVNGTHWDFDSIPMKMPNPMLTPEDTRAVARFIMSQRAPAQGVN